MAFEAAFGVALGLSITLAFLYARTKKNNDTLAKSNIQLKTELDVSRERVKDLPTLVNGLSASTLREQTESFKSTTVDPMNNMMKELRERIDELSTQNAVTNETFANKFDSMMSVAGELRSTTNGLSDVLKSSQKRGRHAEISIERIFELAGLTKDVDYETQPVRDGKKPDFVVHFSNDQTIIIDSKAPLDALWREIDSDDEAIKSGAMDEYVRAIKGHVKTLSGKEYWEGDTSSLDYVVMVMPEYALFPILDHKDKIMEYAMDSRVVLVTPSTLMMLLRTVKLMWRQNEMAGTVKKIVELSVNLHGRMSVFAGHYQKTGKVLEDVVKFYNKGVSSWNSRLLPAADTLAAVGAAVKDMPEIKNTKSRPEMLFTDTLLPDAELHENTDA